MQALPSFGISAWSWLNALGAHSFRVGDPKSAYLLDERGLAPQSLDLPGTWGRVSVPLSSLPKELEHHHSRSAELLLTALEPLRAPLEAARQRYGPTRIGVVLGSSTGGIDATENALAIERATGAMPSDFVFEEAHVYHALIRLLREVLGVEGVGFVISTACSSSGKALAAAQRLLANDQADVVLTGGVDALCEMTLRGFAGLGILAAHGCRPFDQTRSGISIGEGAALLLVERASDSPYRLRSVGESSDAYHATAPHPEGLGARLAMERALAIGGLAATQIDYINAHGTGTEQNDLAEAKAIADVFGALIRFSSTKDRVGHQLGTAGATEALFCLHALQHGILPENRTPDVVDSALSAQPCTTRSSGPLERALSNSFAFGGSNVSVIIERTDASALAAPPPAPLVRPRLFIRGASLWGAGYPHLASWLEGRPNEALGKPAAEFLAVRARGRASVLTRLYAELYQQLQGPEGRFDSSQVAQVFGSAYGEMDTTLLLLDQLGVDKTLSPARFQSSVHNTAAGLLSMITNNRAFSTALAAGSSTFAMSVLEACSYLTLHGGDALVLVADETGPARMLRGANFPALGVGLLLSAATSPPDDTLVEIGPPEMSSLETLPELRASHELCPAAWGVPLVEQLATGSRAPRGHAVRIGPRWQLPLLG